MSVYGRQAPIVTHECLCVGKGADQIDFMVPPTAQGAFERATKRYRESLTAKELTRLDAPVNVGDLLSQAKTISERLQKQRKKGVNYFVAGVDSVAVKLQPFERLLQGACNLSPKGGELLWGSILFILEMARSSVAVFDEVLGFFLDMAHEMEYVKIVEDTFSTSSLVVPVIEALYATIIDFWVEALKYYRRTLKKGVLAGIMNILSSNDMAQQFRDLRREIATQKNTMLEAAMAQHHANYALHRKVDEEQLRTTRQIELIKRINAPAYERDFASADKHRYEKTCEWIRDRGEYVDWTKKSSVPLLVVYGIPGAGKTILSSWLIGQARRQPGSIIFYHYFKEADDSKNTPLAATRSLFHQLYEYLRRTKHASLPRFESDVESVWEERHVDFDHLWSLFSKLIPEIFESQLESGSGLVIVLDAMDECSDSKSMARALRRLIDVASDKVKVAVTSRKSGDHVDEFEPARLNNQTHTLLLEITADDVKHDIGSFTQYKISKIDRLRDEKHRRLREKIVGVLSNAENHQGMFLWAYLMCKQIKYQLNVAAIWKLLDHLPKGLDAMYAHICKRLSENDDHNQEFGRLVLRWIVVSIRPLRFAELEEALKTMQSRDGSEPTEKLGLFDDDDSFDQEYGNGLLWSRKDIVKSCGDLVTYTGLNEGDQIRLIHLSAKQFFSTHPSQLSLSPDLRPVVETYFVNIPDAELAASSTCLDYLLSLPLNSHKYLSTVADFRRSDDGDFKHLYPFFDYSVFYWPEHVFNTIKTQPGDQHMRAVIAKIVVFAASPVAAKWLEQYVFLTDTEYALNTIQRFFEMEIPQLPDKIVHWAKHISRVLDDFTGTLARLPRVASICLHQSLPVGLNSVEPVTGTHTLRRIEATKHAWIYYDPVTDRLFSFDITFEAPLLKCQVIGTGKRLRPIIGVDHTSSTKRFMLCSATVNARRDLIAMTYQNRFEQLSTVCWKIVKPSLANVNDWAQVVFVDHTSWQRGIFDFSYTFRGTFVAFGKDNTLVTPGGIWDIRTKKLVNKPLNIYVPREQFAVTKTCFSANGGRAARLVDYPEGETVEILDMDGIVVLRQGLARNDDHGSSINLLNLSHTGLKLIVQQHNSVLWCLVVDLPRRIEMPTTFSSSEFLFTSDEEKVLATTSGALLEHRGANVHGSMLGVWSFPRNHDGSYALRADLIYIYKIWDNVFVFNLISDDEVVIVDRAGVISRRAIDKRWSPEEDLTLRGSHDMFDRYLGCVVTLDNDDLELFMCDVDERSFVLRVQRISLKTTTPKLISNAETPILPALWSGFCLSPHGHYMATGKQMFEIVTPPDGHSLSLHTYNLGLTFAPGARVAGAFSIDEMRFACAYGDGDDDLILSVFDIIQGNRCTTQRASIRLYDAQQGSLFSVTFSYDDPNMLLITSMARVYVVRVEGHHLVLAGIDERFNPFRFSYSGHSLFYRPTLPTHNDWPQVDISLFTSSKRSLTADFIPPTSMTIDSFYVSLPHMLKFRRYRSTGVLVLDHKFFDENNTSQVSRAICVVPDIYLGGLSAMEVMLVWPKEHDDNLILVIIVGGEPIMMDTGMRSSELMEESQWFKSEI